MLIRKVENYIISHKLIEQGDRIVVGVSGGADSIALLLILYELRDKMGFSLSAHHVNHMIRGLEAQADCAFVKNLCTKMGITLAISRIDVPAYAREHRLSEEEAGRIVRYDEFRKAAGGAKIAVAHNADDQEETILFNIIRGASLTGLSGMKPVSGDIIRPLLGVHRSEIESFLAERNQEYRTDSTNLEDEYTRNKIRHNIMPAIKEINPAFGKRIIELAADAAAADKALTERADEIATATKSKAIYLSIAKLAGSKKDITGKHVKSVAALEGKKVGSEVHLPYGIVAKRGYDDIKLFKKEDAGESDKEKIIEELNCRLDKVQSRPYLGEEIPNNKYTKWIDYDKIESGLLWRYRAKGDRISLGKSCHKKLKDYMIDKKIPKEERDMIPVLADGNNIVLIYGGRLSEDYKVSKKTKNILIINMGEDDG